MIKIIKAQAIANLQKYMCNAKSIEEISKLAKEEQQIIIMKKLSNASDVKIDTIREHLKNNSDSFDTYLYKLEQVNQNLAKGMSLSDVIHWLQGNRYESYSYREENNFMTNSTTISSNAVGLDYATTSATIDASTLCGSTYIANHTDYGRACDRSISFVHTRKTELNIPNGIKVIVENDIPRIEFPSVTDVNIVVPNKVVEVTFADGTKEKSVCREPDVFSLESAISICISKKIMCGSGAYNNAIKRGVKVYEDKLKKEEFEKAEKERIEKKRAKRLAYKERRAAKREELDKAKRNAEKEEQIEIQKEAYIRAMEYMNSKGCVVAN